MRGEGIFIYIYTIYDLASEEEVSYFLTRFEEGRRGLIFDLGILVVVMQAPFWTLVIVKEGSIWTF